MTDLYKVLGDHGRPVHGGTGEWFLPKGKHPGKWMPRIANVHCCSSGYHLVELGSLVEWLRAGCTIYLAEGRGNFHTDGAGKTAFARARLLRQVHISECDLRLFAADCAEHVLPIFLKVRPDDTRPADAIAAARAYARGEIASAARDAAGAAAWAARSAAHWDAARAAAQAAHWDAAQAAARDAYWDAAGAAARDAAGDAAGAAAGAAAARDAAGAAHSAADSAADSAAAWDADSAAHWAARSAEREWQGEQFATYLTGMP